MYRTVKDPRAGHTVTIMGNMANVTFQYNGYDISLGADGSDTRVFNKHNDECLVTVSGTGVEQIGLCVDQINRFMAAGGERDVN